MLEYTNAVSQVLKTIELFNNDDKSKNPKVRTAKFLPGVVFLLCFVSAIIIANNYFDNRLGFSKYVLIVLAAIFNVPFLFYYALWHIQFKDGAVFAHGLTPVAKRF
jgi:hypothetical protein